MLALGVIACVQNLADNHLGLEGAKIVQEMLADHQYLTCIDLSSKLLPFINYQFYCFSAHFRLISPISLLFRFDLLRIFLKL